MFYSASQLRIDRWKDELAPSDYWQIVMQRDTKEYPPFEDIQQFSACRFQCRCIGDDSLEARNRPKERAILSQLVGRMIHRGLQIFSKHRMLLSGDTSALSMILCCL